MEKKISKDFGLGLSEFNLKGKKSRIKKGEQTIKKVKNVDYGLGTENEQVIEIQIIRRKHYKDDYLKGDPVPKQDFHYYIYYGEAARNGKPRKLIELDKKHKGEYNVTKNCVSTNVSRGQKIKWVCIYPFTIYYGGTSILTTDSHGWPRPRQILPYLKAEKKAENHFETQEAYIVNNALCGYYKYFVSVYIPEEEIICVDDPQNHVPPPT
jgi:hypothetical protein